ncbi:hypothetical protein A0J61_06342 [Choanephora cucurbitarum]|uniref:Uncharacterized protein n=1 Tax=Choanephora cucurbitarum TaxID=101091 RepID=A0A1C7NA94_9FUNG|nr:hypothetical protein A0J61_06342 [Choanephora cucurbitarum]
MPSLSKLYKSAKNKFIEKRRGSSSEKSTSSQGTKSVHFSEHSHDSIYYTHSSFEYDRRSLSTVTDWEKQHSEAESMKSVAQDNESDEDIVLFDEEVIRNTKVNRKQGYHSIAALVSYRANIR